MNIITILIVVALVGLFVWGISTFLPQDSKFILLFRVIAIVLTLLWVLQQFHVGSDLPRVHF